jgi:hypothetical protein
MLFVGLKLAASTDKFHIPYITKYYLLMCLPVTSPVALARSATDLAARWRIYPVNDSDGSLPDGGLGLAGYKGYIINGEVEDYIWGFTPNGRFPPILHPR